MYIHIPFCVRKCPYCGFNSIATEDIPEKAYTESVLRELYLVVKQESLEKRAVETIYIGGGTPSLLMPSSVDRLIDGILNLLPATDTLEVSMEVNPGTVDRVKLKELRRAGVNRIVIGMQSLKEERLKSLGRAHTVEDSLRAFWGSTDAGFDSIGIDLIYATPGQNPEGWLEELKEVIKLKPHHVSTYELTVEENTPFYTLRLSGSPGLPDEDTAVRMYLDGRRLLTEAGYTHYEISSFALDGYQCRHNLKYWHCEDYLGLGAGAHSWLKDRGGGIRWHNTEEPARYINAIKVGTLPQEEKHTLSSEDALTERLLMGMRLTSGIDLKAIEEEFGVSLRDSPQWQHLLQEGLIFQEGNTAGLTERGILLSNEVLALLMRS